MGLFGKRDDIPETISNEKYASLQRRAQKANGSMFGAKAIEHRIKSAEQQQKARLS